CAFKPHELTQQFMVLSPFNPDGGRFQHYAPWLLKPELGLYRVFEFLETGDRAAGAPPTPGGRIPGRINLNTIWDPETFLALCDPQPSNNFCVEDLYVDHDHADDPRTLYRKMLVSRTPDGMPGPKDRPFLGFATGYRNASDKQYPDSGLNKDTLLR